MRLFARTTLTLQNYDRLTELGASPETLREWLDRSLQEIVKDETPSQEPAPEIQIPERIGLIEMSMEDIMRFMGVPPQHRTVGAQRHITSKVLKNLSTENRVNVKKKTVPWLHDSHRTYFSGDAIDIASVVVQEWMRNLPSEPTKEPAIIVEGTTVADLTLREIELPSILQRDVVNDSVWFDDVISQSTVY